MFLWMFLGDAKDQKKVFTTEVYEEEDIETIDLREEKINIDVS